MNVQKFNQLKEKHPDAILLFRCGDFYEAYSGDAVATADILGITLTKRSDNGLQMAGFPYHALDTYLPRIIRAGRRVAIVDEEALNVDDEPVPEPCEIVTPAEPTELDKALEAGGEQEAETEEEETAPVKDVEDDEEEEPETEEPERLLAKVETSSRELLSKLSVLEKALPRNASLPICETIRLSLANRVCHLHTADTAGIYTSAALRAAYTGEDCATCIPAKGLAKVVRTLNGQNLEIEVHTRHIVLKYVGGQIALGTKSAKDFPTMPETEQTAGNMLHVHDVTKDWLRAAVKRSLPHIANDEVRPVMNGVHLTTHDGQLDVIATDGRKLVLTTRPYEGTGFSGTMSKPCAEMYLAMADQVADIEFGSKYIGLHCSDFDMFYTQPAPDLRFPNYLAVIPKDCDKVVNIAKSDLVSVLNRILALADGPKTASLRVEMSSLELRSYVSDMFEAQIRDRIFVNSDVSEPMIIDFASEILLSLLSDIDCDKVNLRMIAPNRPALLSGDGEEDNITRLCMPIATTGEAYQD